MKKLLLLFALLIIVSGAIAQATRDVIYLKNGSIIKGTITEQNPPTDLKIEMANGNIITYKYDEIEKITKEEVQQSSNTSSSPNNDKFEIKTPFKNSTYQGKALKTMKSRELKTILQNDPVSFAKYKAGNVLVGVAWTEYFIGTFLVIYNSVDQASNSVYGSYQTDNTLSLLGLVITGVGIPFAIGGNSIKKNAIRQFNNHPISQNFDWQIYPTFSLMHEKSCKINLSLQF
ncbi:MAG TPA: hypothetical protein VE978_12830 [Chitinophagales bacterium]|nr:hypothetical protein [Chitinophagales bacterium]